MKLVHITDLHIAPIGHIPSSRTSTYHSDMWEELEVLKQDALSYSPAAVLISGDIFHLKSAVAYSPRDINMLSEYFKSWGCDIYAIPGNHDLPHSALANLSQSAYLTLCNCTPNLHSITAIGESVSLTDRIRLYGIPYLPLPKFKETLSSLSLSEDFCNILMVHCDAIPDASISLPYEVVSQKYLADTVPNADLILQGHIHLSFPAVKYGRTWISKPWSVGRFAKDYYNTTEILEHQHIPSISVIDIDSSQTVSSVEYHPLTRYKQASQIFIPDALKHSLEKSTQVKSFIASLSEKYGSAENALKLQSPTTVLDSVPAEIREIIEEYLEMAETS